MAFENDNTIQKKKQVNSELKILTTKFCEKGQEMVVKLSFIKDTYFVTVFTSKIKSPHCECTAHFSRTIHHGMYTLLQKYTQFFLFMM